MTSVVIRGRRASTRNVYTPGSSQVTPGAAHVFVPPLGIVSEMPSSSSCLYASSLRRSLSWVLNVLSRSEVFSEPEPDQELLAHRDRIGGSEPNEVYLVCGQWLDQLYRHGRLRSVGISGDVP